MISERALHLSRLRPVLFGLMAALGLCAMPELAGAGRLDKISGGLSNSYETMRQLKMVSQYAGGFFLAAGVGLLFGRKRLELTFTLPLLVFLLGTALVLFSFL